MFSNYKTLLLRILKHVQTFLLQTGALLIMGKWWVYTYTWGMRTDCIMCGVLYKYITILSVLYDEYLASDLQCLLISSQLLNPTISPSCCCWWSSQAHQPFQTHQIPLLILLLFPACLSCLLLSCFSLLLSYIYCKIPDKSSTPPCY